MGNKGFELTCEDTTNSKTGQFQASSGTKLTNNNHAVTHSYDVGSNMCNWNFTWTAPAQGTGTITFYSALVVQEEHTKLCSLEINEKNTSGIENIYSNRISIFPNPASDIINVTTENKQPKQLSIFNRNGQLCISSGLKENIKIDISNLDEGVYFLKIKDKGIISTKRFIKIK